MADGQAPNAPAPDPDEDDLDELDDVLDQFQATGISKDATSTTPQKHGSSAPERPADAATAKEKSPAADIPDDADFAKQLETGMAEMLRELETNPDMAKQFEEMMKTFGPPPGAAPADSTAAPAAASGEKGDPAAKVDASAEPNFQDTIRRTMERMRASNESADAATAPKGSGNPSEDDIMSALMQEIANTTGGEGNDEAFSNMLLGMMEQLTNKDILYEPMKDLNDKFPAWLEERKEGAAKADTVSAEDMARYKEQQAYVKEIVDRFEKPEYRDANAEDREYIVNRMQKMQAAGAPPPELVGDMGAASDMLGDMESGCPQQ